MTVVAVFKFAVRPSHQRDFYATLPRAKENPVDYWIRLNKAADLANEGLHRQAKPLFGLLKGQKARVKNLGKLGHVHKNKKLKSRDWTPIHDQAAEKLKTLLVESVVLAHPDFNCPFILAMDASLDGIGAVLSQVSEGETKARPIAFASYTIMGKTDLTVVQKTIIDTLHKEGKPQTFIAKEAGCSQSAVSKHVNRKLSGRKKCGRKGCTTNRENRSLMRIVKQNRFKNLSKLHKEWTEAGVKASRATTHRRVKEFGYSCRIPLVKPLLNHRQRQRRHTWPKEKKNWTVAQ
ncbi:hypothetical protein QTP70_008485 [Hemibagrus guttatus]|uniref:Reverse transcriptase/retrotransposon-derived protein RNase H-like domain-containing protein n=1 Tax=Hemibagrus guttatus TaxID=175788 RepID=A0AAE0R1C7_9TELE|nr:hypothetical protein QTP70_008485 [Hemibagrus guttatus]